MFARLSLICICVMFYVPVSLADQGQGQMGAQIIDPLQMKFKDLVKFCEDEPQTVACEIYREELLDTEKEQEHSYEVLTGNFQ